MILARDAFAVVGALFVAGCVAVVVITLAVAMRARYERRVRSRRLDDREADAVLHRIERLDR